LPINTEGGKNNNVHIHVSLWKNGMNVFGGKGTAGTSGVGESFMAGV
jgi:glutamine synthetase